MAFCEYPRDFMLFDVTPVENLFITEHMPAAPGDYVRVYLYGLMLCRYPDEDMSAANLAKALNMKEEEILEAFRYWERAGLVMRLNDRPPRYRYISPRRAATAADEDDDPYRYRDYFNALQRVFGADRLIEPNEQSKALDWLETLKLPEEVALYMAEKIVKRMRENRRSLRYAFRELDATAMVFADEGIRTVEEAEAWLERDSEASETAKAVLRQMGVRRAPTADELKMAKGWTEEWKLGREEILEACSAMTNATNPSFSYLNGILRRKAKGDGIEHYAEIRQILAALGGGGMPTEAQSAVYSKLLRKGFDHEAIEYAAGQCSQKGKHTFEALERRLDAWQKEGIMTRQAAEEYARRREPGEKLCLRIFDALGLTGSPTAKDVMQADEWMKAFPEDVILYAAERSKGAQRAWVYMSRILHAWADKGISTLDAAKSEAAEAASPAGRNRGEMKQGTRKVNPAQEYGQREYDDDSMRDIALDISKLPGEDE